MFFKFKRHFLVQAKKEEEQALKALLLHDCFWSFAPGLQAV